MENVKRICLWSGPRNISTALMYSFAQRNDTKVYDEPLYGYYLANTDAKEYHPGANDILRTMELDGLKVLEMMMGPQDKPVIFYKNMTHHLLDLPKAFMKDVVNVILTRDPLEMITSFAKVIKNPKMSDVGYEDHIKLLNYLDSIKAKSIILDSIKVLVDPKNTIDRLCKEIGIPFSDTMLSWTAGARTEDGIWAEYWYRNVHTSTGFMAYKPKNEGIPNHLTSLLKESQKHYKELIERSL
ncbi:MAG: hypothetical protein ACI8XB_001259 [Patiriisocius sp.]|jgi:hypothetical protein